MLSSYTIIVLLCTRRSPAKHGTTRRGADGQTGGRHSGFGRARVEPMVHTVWYGGATVARWRKWFGRLESSHPTSSVNVIYIYCTQKQVNRSEIAQPVRTLWRSTRHRWCVKYFWICVWIAKHCGPAKTRRILLITSCF